MATQLLVYENAVPVSQSRHAQWSVEVLGNYAVAGEVNTLPLMAVQMPMAAIEHCIVFVVGNAQTVQPAVVVGLRERENLYLAPDGAWHAKYVSAFLRRYPFVFSPSEHGNTFTLCIDEPFPGFSRDGSGARLCGDDGKPSAYAENVLKFLRFCVTQAFCDKLRKLDLLEPMQVQVRLPSGQRAALTGFMVVSRERLKQLCDEVLADPARTDELERIYQHLTSLRNFSVLSDRLGMQQPKPA